MNRPPLSGPLAVLATAAALASPHLAHATTVGPVVQVTAPSGQRNPDIVWESANDVYLIVWEDSRNDVGGPTGTGDDLFVSRIQRDGTQLDTDGVSLLAAADRAGNQSLPAITYRPTLVPPTVITWTDPRNAIPDVFGARYDSGTETALRFEVTSNTPDTESFSDLAAGASRVLSVYQVNASTGIVIRARRFFNDFVTDGGAFSVVRGGRNPSVIADGTRFVFGVESSGSRALVATVDESSGTSVSTATVSTSTAARRVQVARLGTDVVAVWQDDRGVDRDIYGAVVDPATLMLRGGSDFAVSTASEVQQAPEVAGDATGALVVWQDRRNTSANAEIFGARIDAVTGAVRDPRGFPLFTFSGNAFEAAIAKGPARDYLVAAIRFGSPSRLYWRVVRDEDPDGTMTGTGRLVVPADGVTTATVGFGRARGASGLTVVDSTLYDVTVSSVNPVILEPDADPTRPGHQVEARQGIVQVSLQSTARERVTVSVRSVEGASNGTAMLEFLNVPPEVSDLVVRPTDPRSVDDLELSYTYFDVNGDPEAGTIIQWTKDAALQTAWDNQTTVAASATSRGEVWRARVDPGDGADNRGQFTLSSSVTIGNTPPEIVDANLVRAFNPNLPVRAGERIELRYRFVDADNDSEGPTVIEWYDGGARVDRHDGERALEGADVVKGQDWTVRIVPNDTFEDGEAVWTSTLTVVNTAPVADAGENLEVVERRPVTLDGSGSSDRDEADTLQFTWTQTQGIDVELDDPSSATPTFTAPSVPNDTLVNFDLVVTDGEETSMPDTMVVTIRAVPDQDGDGFDDEEEEAEGTNPASRDTDRDQLDDGVEVANGLDPLDQDSDDDGLRDGQEGQACRNGCAAAPLDDADGDQVINALDPDSDDDGLPDGLELGFERPLEPGTVEGFAVEGTDTSAGFFSADQDVGTETDPNLADTDEDGLSDGEEDTNANGRVDPGESDPLDPLDPGIACGQPGDCPSGLVCVEGLCQQSGTSCNPLPATVECCAGGCVASADLVEAVCVAGSASAQCPIGSRQCSAGSCSAAVPSMPEDDGCRCADPARDGQGRAIGAVFLLLGWIVVRRRR